MSKPTVILVPAFLQEMALQLNLILMAAALTKRKFVGETVSFVYETIDRKFQLCFKFEVSYYDDGEDKVFKVSKIQDLTSVKMQTLSYDKVLQIGGNQLKKTTKLKLTRLIEEFVGSKAR